MTIDEINTRLSAIADEIKLDGADLDALEKEVDQLQARKLELANAETERRALLDKIADGNADAEVIASTDENNETEERTMNKDELTRSAAYMDAYAEYVKRGYDREAFAEAAARLDDSDKELRTLMTIQATDGTIAIPTEVEERVQTNWENEAIMSLVPVIDFAGDYQVQFEVGGSDATLHEEDGEPVEEEELALGIATITQDSWKKWIGVTKKVLKQNRGQALLDYLYDEIAHKIAVGAAGQLIGIIANLPSTATATTPSAQAITEAPSVVTVADATAQLSAEATNPVIVMNRKTAANFTAAALAANFAVDVYEGLPRIYTNNLPAYDAASAGDVYMIVGDFNGARRTRPASDANVEFTFDSITQKKSNIVEIQGEQFGGVGVVACDRFTLVKKPSTI